VLVGKGLDLLLALEHGFGHRLARFGNPDFCAAGPLSLS
jgi:hypothetical protein